MRISATQIAKVRRCERLIGFEYCDGIKLAPSKKQEFGKAVHKQLEDWLRDGKAPDDTAVGKVAKQGIQSGWLPAPRTKGVGVEQSFTLPWRKGVQLIGFIDCNVPPPVFDVPVVIDHKTTSDLRWAMSEVELQNDPQAIIYAIWATVFYKAPEVIARWIYYAASNPKNGPRKPKGSQLVEYKFNVRELQTEKLELIRPDINRIVEIRSTLTGGQALPASPESCELYEGCFYKDKCNLTAEDRFAAFIEKENLNVRRG